MENKSSGFGSVYKISKQLKNMNKGPKTLEEAFSMPRPTDKERAIFLSMLEIEETLLDAHTKDTYLKMRVFILALHAILERLLNHLLKQLGLSCGEEASFSCKVCKLESHFKLKTREYLKDINRFRNGFAHLYPQTHKKFGFNGGTVFDRGSIPVLYDLLIEMTKDYKCILELKLQKQKYCHHCKQIKQELL